MAYSTTMSLADFAAAQSLSKISLAEVRDALYNSLVALFTPLYICAARIAAVDAEPSEVNERVAAKKEVLDDTTLNELSDVATSIYEEIRVALENSCARRDEINFGVKGTLAPEDKAAFLCAFALRSTEVMTCDVDGVRIASKLPLSVSFTFNVQHAVKVHNDEARKTTTVGIGYHVSLDDITIRSGMDLAAWERLGRIASVQRGLGDNFGTQYQVYLFSKVRRFALGYATVGLELEGGLPVTPINLVQTISDWKVEEKEGV